MKIGELMKRPGHSFSFEFFPPKDEIGENILFQTTVSKLKALNPTFVSVTYGAGGSNSKNTMNVVLRMKKEAKLEPMPHMTCVGQSNQELKTMLEDYRKNGIENVLALRGDPPKGNDVFIPEKEGYCYAKDLVKLALSVGGYSIGVAVYPEGHLESPNLEMDMVYTREKIDAGADFAVTQMFFDNRYFYDFMERAIKAGIRIPIIPGIMPITDIKNIQKFSKSCGTALPGYIVGRFESTNSPVDVGIELATQQCDDLLKHGVKHLHFYTLNKPDVVTRLVNNLGLTKHPAGVK